MPTQDYLITQARMPTPEPRDGVFGQFDAKRTALRPRRTLNPLACQPYAVRPGLPRSAVAEDPRKAERAAILATVTANDNELLPRVRNGGDDHPYLRQFTGVLSFWRRMANPPAELGTWAANDNLGDGQNAENEHEVQDGSYVTDGNPLPKRAESWLSMLPVPVRVSVRSKRNRADGKPGRMTTHYDWHPDDVDYEPVQALGCSWNEENANFHRRVKTLGRIKRLGGFEFSTTDNATAKDKLTAPSVDKDGRPRRYDVSLGAVIATTKDGRRTPVTQDNYHPRDSEAVDAILAASQSRHFYVDVLKGPRLPSPLVKLKAPRKVQPDVPVTGEMPAVTYCPPGLPMDGADPSRLFMGIGSTKPGAKRAVRRAVDGGYAIWDAKGDAAAVERFRAANDNHAKVLDACLVAANLTDIAKAVGKLSHHTGEKKLAAACTALQDFLNKNTG